MNFLANPAFFEYFSPRYKIYDLVYFNCLISFINSYPTPIHPLSYSQRGKKQHSSDHITLILHGFPSSPFHAMILWPSVLFPFLSPSCFNSELNCHLFKEAFCDSPPYTHHKVTVTRPLWKHFSHWYWLPSPVDSGQGPHLLCSRLYLTECLEHSKFSTCIF